MNSNNFMGDENLVKWSFGGEGITPTSQCGSIPGLGARHVVDEAEVVGMAAGGDPGRDELVDLVHRTPT